MLNHHFDPFPTLTTGRLTLRNITMNDVNEIFVQRSHPVIRKYIKRPPAKDLDEAADWIKMVTDQQGRDECIHWAIVPKGEEQLVGLVCLWNIEPENDKAELGYGLHPDFFGQGLMSETLSAVLPYGFLTMRLRTIDAYTNKNNEPSLKLLKQQGFKRNQVFENESVDKAELEYNVVYTLHSFKS